MKTNPVNAFLSTVVCLIFVSSIANAQIADTVYTNGKIYTVNEKQPWHWYSYIIQARSAHLFATAKETK
jgi:hypothetical protein